MLLPTQVLIKDRQTYAGPYKKMVQKLFHLVTLQTAPIPNIKHIPIEFLQDTSLTYIYPHIFLISFSSMKSHPKEYQLMHKKIL